MPLCAIYQEIDKKLIYIDVLFFVSLIYPTFRLNFHILKKVLETRHLVEIDYSGAPSLKEISRSCRIPLEIKITKMAA